MLDAPLSLFLLFNNTEWPKWLIFLINSAIFIVAIKLIYYIIKKVVRLVTRKTKTTLDDDLVKIIEYPLLSLLSVIFILSALNIFQFPETISIWVSRAGKAAIIVIITWFLYSFIGFFHTHILSRISKKSQSELDDQLFPILRKILRIVLLILSLIYILDVFGINITPLLAGVGIGGLALAFAAQKILADLFGGISILADQAYFVGDRVRINGIEGTIIEIGLRSTKIKTLENNISTIPNSIVSANVVENITKDSKQVVVKTTLGLVYDTPQTKIKLAKKLVEDIVKKNKHIVKYSGMSFLTFNTSSIDFLVIYMVDSYENKLVIMDDINTKIKASFEKNKIEFAYPTQTLYVKKN